MTIGLCLLVWNELRGCEHDVPKIPRYCFDEIFAMDGGSGDGTVEYLASQNIVTVQQPRRGYNNAYIAAFERTSCDALVVFHPKGSVDPQSLEAVVAAMRTGKQLVIASRNAPASRNEEDDQFLKPRKWFVLGLSALSALLWWRGGGPVIWDVLNGYRGMRKDAFFAMDPVSEGLSMDLQMVVRAYRLGYSRCEVPIQEQARLEGTTHFKALPTGIKLLKYIWFELKRGKPVAVAKTVALTNES